MAAQLRLKISLLREHRPLGSGAGLFVRDSTIAVCIATRGRPDILTRALVQVAAQTLKPTQVLICPTSEADVDSRALGDLDLPIRCVPPSQGLTRQRNMLLREADAADVVLFIDDDFLLAPDYIERMTAAFSEDATLVCLTGLLLADGANNDGLTPGEGLALLRGASDADTGTADVFNAYGCNMALRWSALRGRGCWFDEQLPLYGWLEDVDFSRRAAGFGTVRKCNAMRGVHLGVKHGRISGLRFGYSQIANQIYLARKGTVTLQGAVRKVVENLAANAAGVIRGNEAFVDRRGRLKGNLIGLLDGLRGRSSPLRVLDL